MRVITSILALLVLSGCQWSITDIWQRKQIPQPPPHQLIIADQYVGLNERTDRVTLREFLGVDPVQVEWCAAFVNSVLTEIGLESTKSLMARSYLDWGVSTDEPTPGDIMVFSRGSSSWQGHVGFYVATAEYKNKQYWIVLGGNQDNSVSYKLYPVGYHRHIDTRTTPDVERQQVLIKQQWMLGGIPLEVIE